jgi:hypothetical protein
MKTSLKSVIEALNRDANQLEHHAQKLKAISPDLSLDLESDAELIDQRGGVHQKAGRDSGTVGVELKRHGHLAERTRTCQTQARDERSPDA